MSSFQTITPIDGSVYVERPYAEPSEIARALKRAETAQRSWKRTSLIERQNVITRAVDILVSRRLEIATEITWQMGRPIAYAPSEVDGFAERARHMIAIAPSSLEPVDPGPKPGFRRYIKREPVGVVFVVAPWNYPYLTSANAIVPALLAGNTVILKHSIQTPLCAERYAQAFTEAGLPDGVFQFLHLSHEDTANVIQAPEISFAAFTGSVAGGERIEAAASGRFIGVGLELGGKDPAYIREDADLEHAVATTIDGAFFNSGQSCCGVERIYVHTDLFDEFVRRAVVLASAYKLDHPDLPETTLGPMARAAAADSVRDQIAEAVAAGAKTRIESGPFPMDERGSPYLAPQLLTGVDHSMRLMREETFGPVVGVMPVKGDDEAIALMNDSDFGLTASVFTRDEDAAVRIGDRVDTGTWFMNRCDFLDPALAWSGVKRSGRGCALSTLGFEQLTRPKSYHLKNAT